MKKNIILLGMLLISGLASSQVGINTDTPVSTLDLAGKAADISSLDGITALRLTGDQLRSKIYTTAQTGTLVYVTVSDATPSGQTVYVTTTSYFYFDGTVWQKVNSGTNASVNIYDSTGSFTSNRTFTLNGKALNL